LSRALAGGADPVRVEEALLQLVAFAGYGRAITAFAVLRDLVPGEPSRLPAGSSGRRARGLRTCRRVYGPVIGRLRDRLRSYHPDLERWILEHGYGEILSRGVLSLRERELLAAAVLGALDLPLQQESHLRGAMRCGVGKRQLRNFLRAAGVGLPCR
jgi:4-carboxymuconolactone decarboxylase